MQIAVAVLLVDVVDVIYSILVNRKVYAANAFHFCRVAAVPNTHGAQTVFIILEVAHLIGRAKEVRNFYIFHGQRRFCTQFRNIQNGCACQCICFVIAYHGTVIRKEHIGRRNIFAFQLPAATSSVHHQNLRFCIHQHHIISLFRVFQTAQLRNGHFFHIACCVAYSIRSVIFQRYGRDGVRSHFCQFAVAVDIYFLEYRFNAFAAFHRCTDGITLKFCLISIAVGFCQQCVAFFQIVFDDGIICYQTFCGTHEQYVFAIGHHFQISHFIHDFHRFRAKSINKCPIAFAFCSCKINFVCIAGHHSCCGIFMEAYSFFPFRCAFCVKGCAVVTALTVHHKAAVIADGIRAAFCQNIGFHQCGCAIYELIQISCAVCCCFYKNSSCAVFCGHIVRYGFAHQSTLAVCANAFVIQVKCAVFPHIGAVIQTTAVFIECGAPCGIVLVVLTAGRNAFRCHISVVFQVINIQIVVLRIGNAFVCVDFTNRTHHFPAQCQNADEHQQSDNDANDVGAGFCRSRCLHRCFFCHRFRSRFFCWFCCFFCYRFFCRCFFHRFFSDCFFLYIFCCLCHFFCALHFFRCLCFRGHLLCLILRQGKILLFFVHISGTSFN